MLVIFGNYWYQLWCFCVFAFKLILNILRQQIDELSFDKKTTRGCQHNECWQSSRLAKTPLRFHIQNYHYVTLFASANSCLTCAHGKNLSLQKGDYTIYCIVVYIPCFVGIVTLYYRNHYFMTRYTLLRVIWFLHYRNHYQWDFHEVLLMDNGRNPAPPGMYKTL